MPLFYNYRFPNDKGLCGRAGLYKDLAPYDLLYIPGSFGTRPLMEEARFISYLKTGGTEHPVASVGTGALLLGRAGYLEDKRATTHHSAYDTLRALCREAVTGAPAVERHRHDAPEDGNLCPQSFMPSSSHSMWARHSAMRGGLTASEAMVVSS